MKKKVYRGITLVEIMVVIAIIGVLATVVVPFMSYINSVSKARIVSRTASKLALILDAERLFYAKQNYYVTLSATNIMGWGNYLGIDPQNDSRYKYGFVNTSNGNPIPVMIKLNSSGAYANATAAPFHQVGLSLNGTMGYLNITSGAFEIWRQ